MERLKRNLTASSMMLVLALFAVPALAQGANQGAEIIVTASRYEDYQDLTPPHVSLTKRADFAVVSLEIRSDTRDESQRLGEMRQALTGLESRARASNVSLALAADEASVLRPFSVSAAIELLRGGNRPDTSRVSIVLRTPVAERDTLDAIHGRFEGFIRSTPKPGRVEMQAEDLNLTLVDPEQYRTQLLAEIAADGTQLAQRFGDRYGVQIGALERRVVWTRVSDLELMLFIPYTMQITPR